MGEKKTAKAKKVVRKTTTRATVAKKTTSSKKIATVKPKATKKSATRVVRSATKKKQDKAVVTEAANKSTKALGHSVLNIADHAVQRVSENLGQNLKKSEHWHVAAFTLLVIVAAYFSYQYSVKGVSVPERPTDTAPVVEVPTAPVDQPAQVAFNFPNDYAWLTQDISDDVTIAAGETAQFEMVIKNSSKAIWYREGDNPFRLGIVQPVDGIFPFMAASVIGENQTRVAPNRNRVEMMQEQVAPGETATFRLEARAVDWNNAPLAAGRYAFVVGFLVEGKGSLVRQPLTWVMNVR